ncbi:MAG: chemotaxis protein CheW [Geobacteraceae bacterium]|nr:chemotaxis protein CheW [Geobacteraceae bacterium]
MTDAKSYNIRSILEEMQQEYWQGLTAKDEAQEELLECITFVLGGEQYAFETSFASEVIRVPKLVKLPGNSKLVVGVFNLRGEIIAAIDIRQILGVAELPLSASARIIVIKGKNFTTGILAEAVLGVNSLSLGLFEPIVKSVDPSAREFLRGQINLGTEMSMLLDIAHLLDSPSLVINN